MSFTEPILRRIFIGICFLLAIYIVATSFTGCSARRPGSSAPAQFGEVKAGNLQSVDAIDRARADNKQVLSGLRDYRHLDGIDYKVARLLEGVE